MADKLGIAVTTLGAMPHVLGLATAAKSAGKQVELFFTGEAVRLTQDPRFSRLLELARVGVCESSYIANGYQGKPVPGLGHKDFVTQGRNAEMVEACDRYLIL